MAAPTWSEGSQAEAERQLAAATARHREAVASMQERGRPEAGQHVAIKSAGIQTPSALEPADLEDLHHRLETAWSAWRQALGRRET